MHVINKISPTNLAFLATLLGALFVRLLDPNEQGVIGNFFSSVGQTLQLTSAQAENLSEKCDMIKEYNELSKKLEDLKKKLC